MLTLTRNDLWSLEEYAVRRADFYQKYLQHRNLRQIALGENARLYFEDEMSIRFQIQEMLRIEKIFEAAGIQEELDAYNPLLPDGSNWKVTFTLEYPDPVIRKQKLALLKGIEKTVWLQVQGYDRVFPICNEDLERENDEKTSAIHFMRFELNAEMITALKNKTALEMGIDHEHHKVGNTCISNRVLESLIADLQ